MKLKWKCAGHLARKEDKRWTSRAVTSEGPKGKRKRLRPPRRWVDDIKETTGNKCLLSLLVYAQKIFLRQLSQ